MTLYTITMTDHNNLWGSVNAYFDGLFHKIQQNPFFAGLVISALGAILLIAVILDADWVLEPTSHRFFNLAFIVNHFGRTSARILMGLLSSIIIFAGIFISFGYLYSL